MLHRSAIVIFGIVAMEVSSVFYVNSPSIIYHYLFAFQSALLGFIILATYVMSGEVLVVAPALHKLKRQMESDDECASEPTKDRELEKELSSSSSAAGAIGATTLPSNILLRGVCEPLYPEARGVAVGIDARDYVSEAAAAAAGFKLPTPEIQIHHVDDIRLENYASPRARQPSRPREQRSVNFAEQPYAKMEHQHAQPYKELVSLAGLQAQPHAHPHTHYQQTELQHLQAATIGHHHHRPIHHRTSPDCKPQTILCSAQVETCLGSTRTVATMPDVTLAINGEADLIKKPAPPGQHLVVLPIVAPVQQLQQPQEQEPATAAQQQQQQQQQQAMPDIANTMEQRKQPDGEDVVPKPADEIVALDEEEVLTTNGMLDRISHDLDYLLNRTKEDA